MLTIAQIVIVGKIDSTVHCVIPEYVGFHTHEMSFLITFDIFVFMLLKTGHRSMRQWLVRRMIPRG